MAREKFKNMGSLKPDTNPDSECGTPAAHSDLMQLHVKLIG